MRRIRGIRDRVPGNTILGRKGSGRGPVQELKLNNDGSISVSNAGGGGGGGSGGARRYSVGFCFIGTPDASSLLWQFSCAEAFSWQVDAATSQGDAETAPSGDVDLDVLKNGVSVGTISFANGSDNATFDTGGVAVSFVAGDILTVETPSNMHSIESISVLFAGVPV